MRVESIRPFPGAEAMSTNMTSLHHGTLDSRDVVVRLLGDDGWDITGGGHPICRKLPMFGPQRVLAAPGNCFLRSSQEPCS